MSAPRPRAPEPGISLCMIVRNEEHTLRACLESARDVCDDIVVVDTGSTDATVAIAETAGARVHHHPWEGSFSAARNHALRYARRAWILQLDADETLPPVTRRDLRPVLETAGANAASFLLRNPVKGGAVAHRAVRAFHNAPGVRYEGIVHNVVRVPDVRCVHTRLVIDHHGYAVDAAAMDAKFRRSRPLLERQIAERPDDPYAHLNLAKLCAAAGDFAGAETHALHVHRLVPAVARRDDIYFGIQYILGWAALMRGRPADALRHLREGLALRPDDPDCLYLHGVVLYNRGDFGAAAAAFQDYLAALPRYVSGDAVCFHPVNTAGSVGYAHHYAGRSAMALGRLDEARAHLSRAAELLPDFAPARDDLRTLAARAAGPLQEACR
jgi:Flp pilus assembly protein TadD